MTDTIVDKIFDRMDAVAAWPHPIGTLVIYFPVKGEFTDAFVSKTRSGPWVLDDHKTVVVALEGKAGGVHVGHLVPIASLENAFTRLLAMRDAKIKDLEQKVGELTADLFNAKEDLRRALEIRR